MKVQIKMAIMQVAKGSGGDKYFAPPLEGETKPVIIYFPHSLSRIKGRKVRTELTVTVEGVDE